MAGNGRAARGRGDRLRVRISSAFRIAVTYFVYGHKKGAARRSRALWLGYVCECRRDYFTHLLVCVPLDVMTFSR